MFMICLASSSSGNCYYLELARQAGREPVRLLMEAGIPYKEIIAKYDQMAEEADPAKKEAISKEINELTKKLKNGEIPAAISMFPSENRKRRYPCPSRSKHIPNDQCQQKPAKQM